ncbi:MAG TPA: amidohydrolase family protein [Planctomycetota bacterium]|nr:amidohydrolase family protein [Planctomycetota bacterium]
MTWSLYPSRWTALFVFFAVHWFFTLHRGTTHAAAAEVPTAFTGAKIYPIAGDPIPAGVLIIEGGKISSVGPEASTQVPPGARRVDVSGKVILPGLICTHSHVGGIGGADGSGPIQPDIRIFDSLDVRNTGFRRAVAGGLTTLNIMPGSGHLLGGRTVYVKLRGGRTIEDLFIRDEDGKPLGGVKMANGTNSRRAPPFPGTRAKSAALVRSAFLKAREYRDKVASAAGDPDKLPPRDLGLETIADVLDRKLVVHHHTHRHDDIVTVLRLAKEFNFRVVLHHVSEGWKVAREIAEAGVACSVILVDSPGGKLEAIDFDYRTGTILEKAGVPTAFHTDDWITDSRLFLRMPALAVRAGMSREGALKAVTLTGAVLLDLEKRIGSLEPGKDADFVILDGDPLSVYTHVLETWVEGTKVFDRSDPRDRLHAVGGPGASQGEEEPYCCCGDREESAP